MDYKKSSHCRRSKWLHQKEEKTGHVEKHIWSFWNFKEFKWKAAGNKRTCWDVLNQTELHLYVALGFLIKWPHWQKKENPITLLRSTLYKQTLSQWTEKPFSFLFCYISITHFCTNMQWKISIADVVWNERWFVRAGWRWEEFKFIVWD